MRSDVDHSRLVARQFQLVPAARVDELARRQDCLAVVECGVNVRLDVPHVERRPFGLEESLHRADARGEDVIVQVSDRTAALLQLQLTEDGLGGLRPFVAPLLFVGCVTLDFAGGVCRHVCDELDLSKGQKATNRKGSVKQTQKAFGRLVKSWANNVQEHQSKTSMN